MTKSKDLFSETERFGQLLDKETHSIIYDRYNFVSNYIKQKDVLEIGSGSGIGLNYFKQFCHSITVLEFSVENYLVSCRALGKQIEDKFFHNVEEIISNDNKFITSINFKLTQKNVPAQLFINKLKQNGYQIREIK